MYAAVNDTCAMISYELSLCCQNTEGHDVMSLGVVPKFFVVFCSYSNILHVFIRLAIRLVRVCLSSSTSGHSLYTLATIREKTSS